MTNQMDFDQLLHDKETGENLKSTAGHVTVGYGSSSQKTCKTVCEKEDPCGRKEFCDPCGSGSHVKIGIGFHLTGHSKCPDLCEFNLRAAIMEMFLSLLFVMSVTFFAICTCNTDDLLLAKFIFSIMSGISLFVCINIGTGYCHAFINPAVTLLFMMCKHVGWLNGLIYIFAQFVGGFAGAAIVLIFFSTTDCGFGVPVPGLESDLPSVVAYVPAVIPCYKVFLAEAFGTSILFTGIYFIHTFSNDPTLAIGALLTVVTFIFAPFSGASFNAARYLPPAIYAGIFTCWPAYVFAPLVGVLIAWVLIKLICLCNRTWKSLCKDDHCEKPEPHCV